MIILLVTKVSDTQYVKEMENQAKTMMEMMEKRVVYQKNSRHGVTSMEYCLDCAHC